MTRTHSSVCAQNKVRLYIVAEKRLATFVRTSYGPGWSRAAWRRGGVPQHAVVMQPWHNAQGTWYSDEVADGTGCTGQATTTDTPAQPHTTPEREVSMNRYSIPALHLGLTVIVGWDNPLVTFFAQVFDPLIEEDEEACLLWIGTVPRGHPHGRGAPGTARRLGQDPDRHRGPPSARSASRHAADPAPAVGAPAPARRWGDQPRPRLTLSRAGASCSRRPGTSPVRP